MSSSVARRVKVVEIKVMLLDIGIALNNRNEKGIDSIPRHVKARAQYV